MYFKEKNDTLTSLAINFVSFKWGKPYHYLHFSLFNTEYSAQVIMTTDIMIFMCFGDINVTLTIITIIAVIFILYLSACKYIFI